MANFVWNYRGCTWWNGYGRWNFAYSTSYNFFRYLTTKCTGNKPYCIFADEHSCNNYSCKKSFDKIQICSFGCINGCCKLSFGCLCCRHCFKPKPVVLVWNFSYCTWHFSTFIFLDFFQKESPGKIMPKKIIKKEVNLL